MLCYVMFLGVISYNTMFMGNVGSVNRLPIKVHCFTVSPEQVHPVSHLFTLSD